MPRSARRPCPAWTWTFWTDAADRLRPARTRRDVQTQFPVFAHPRDHPWQQWQREDLDGAGGAAPIRPPRPQFGGGGGAAAAPPPPPPPRFLSGGMGWPMVRRDASHFRADSRSSPRLGSLILWGGPPSGSLPGRRAGKPLVLGPPRAPRAATPRGPVETAYRVTGPLAHDAGGRDEGRPGTRDLSPKCPRTVRNHDGHRWNLRRDLVGRAGLEPATEGL